MLESAHKAEEQVEPLHIRAQHHRCTKLKMIRLIQDIKALLEIEGTWFGAQPHGL